MQTKIFAALVVAMIILLAIAWYTWPGQPAAQEMTQPAAVATTTAATTSTQVETTDASSTVSLYPSPSLGEQQGIVTFGSQKVYVDLAQNTAQQELGLGNRASLGADQGMLFIFPNDDIHMFWMKDMSFSIDMIWMSDDGTVMYIQPNTAPSTYPDAFGPDQESRYVLEVPANFAAQYGITVGSKATLP